MFNLKIQFHFIFAYNSFFKLIYLSYFNFHSLIHLKANHQQILKKTISILTFLLQPFLLLQFKVSSLCFLSLLKIFMLFHTCFLIVYICRCFRLFIFYFYRCYFIFLTRFLVFLLVFRVFHFIHFLYLFNPLYQVVFGRQIVLCVILGAIMKWKHVFLNLI